MKKKILIPLIIVASCAVGIGGYSMNNANTPEPKVVAPTVQTAAKVTEPANITSAMVTSTQAKKPEIKESEKATTSKVEKPVVKDVQKSEKPEPPIQKTENKHVNNTEVKHIDNPVTHTKVTTTPESTTHINEVKDKEVAKSTETKHIEHKEASEKKKETPKPVKHIDITNEYLTNKFASSHPNSRYNDIRNGMYYEVTGSLGLRENNAACQDALNKINNISDSQLKSILPKGLDPNWASPRIEPSGYDAIPVSVRVNGTTKTARVVLGSMG
ncbi:MAG: hypothetical protein ACRCWG_05820 [Sarcina sp.]